MIFPLSEGLQISPYGLTAPNGDVWSFGSFTADGINAAILRNGGDTGWKGSLILCDSPGLAMWVRGVTVWWQWNGAAFVPGTPSQILPIPISVIITPIAS